MNSPASAPGPFAIRTHPHLRSPRPCPRESLPLSTAAAAVGSPAYLSKHLASHGYLVAALDHSEVVAPEIADDVGGHIANGVPDARFLLDYMLAGAISCAARPDPDRIAIVGHSSAAGLPWPCRKPTHASRL